MQGLCVLDHDPGQRPPMPLFFRILFILCLLGFAYLTVSVIKDWDYKPADTAAETVRNTHH